ncbi:GAF domain-containing protein [Gilvibacter sp. SZ-19]|uniref:GAF domain-containing protein n=1 Tax=Gilvibacter sp. SZ-19 TaxID=754429 RepID=UPI000B3D3DCF|nr:GAF domain-containing protein [Gilvibacter sp. SZ-19]ARV10885.1 GAF domain-containing protein [Gilvibacter sp. SZ-19]
MQLSDDNFPLNIKIGFGKLFEQYKEHINSEDPLVQERAKAVLELSKKHPELVSGLETPEEVERLKPQIDFILSDLFAPVLQQNEIKVATIPFRNYIFKSTKRFENILKNAEGNYDLSFTNFTADEFYVMACSVILGAHYGKRMDSRRPFHFAIPDANKITRNYRVLYNGDFIEMKPTDRAVDLTEDDIAELIDNFDDIDLWKSKFPPQSWEFNGFVIGNMYDATVDVALSDLKATLLRQNDEKADEDIEEFEKILQAIFNLPEIKMGFAVYNEEEHQFEPIPQSKNINSFLLNGEMSASCDKALCPHSYESLFVTNEYYCVSDVDKFHKLYPKNPLYKKLKQQHAGSAILAAVRDEGKVLGVLELVSPNPQELNTVNANKLNDIMPYVIDSVRSSKRREENEIELLIQHECTSIHPSVHWKFVQESERVLAKRYAGEEVGFRQIVFENVYPLFGQIDIKGSSTARNHAIQADLILQLAAIKDVIKLGFEAEPLPVYEQFIHRIDTYLELIHKDLKVDSEQRIRAFIQDDIKPLFEHFDKLSPSLSKAIANYREQLDPNLKLIYKHRKDYDDSITLINKKMSELLDKKQQKAQAMYPHYFERFKTDGVEHNMYIGESITKRDSFNKVYLYNLRLWQLQVMCEMENAYYNMKPKLPLDLDVTSMILVFNAALSVRFRMDEKRFDVDGTYNARYEVVKKRVDKAYIKGTDQRVTEKGKITIVYSQKSDEREYLRYIQFLQSKNVLSDQVEIVQLEDLQGVTGLKAIRVDVLYKTKKNDKQFYTYQDLMKEIGN